MERVKGNFDGTDASERCDRPSEAIRKRISKRNEKNFTGKSHLAYKKLNAMDEETLDVLEKMEEGEQNGQ